MVVSHGNIKMENNAFLYAILTMGRCVNGGIRNILFFNRLRGDIVKYQIYIKYLDGTSSRLLYRGRTEWCIKTARKHLHDCICEKINDSEKWLSVDYFAIVAA